MFTSNVDGHFLAAGFDASRVVECHGSIHFVQAFNPRVGDTRIVDAAPVLAPLRVDPDTFLADEDTLPHLEVAGGARVLARPNILMFGDYGWREERTAAQEARLEAYTRALPRDARVVVIEIGAGLAVPTVRAQSEGILDSFPRATLLRVNPAEPDGPRGRTVPIAAPALATLAAIDAALGGAAGIGSAR